MPFTSVNDLIPILQVAIGPVILVSGVGLLLLTMTNRLGRVIDRARSLAQEQRDNPQVDSIRILSQLEILTRRAELIRRAITLSSLSVLFAALLVITLFFTALLQLETAIVIGLLFMVCMLSLIASLIYFIRDLNLSLTALKYDLQDVINPDSSHS
ncbi:MAG: DUF2721 domain-containing protein [Anaerolineales bacterium]